MQKEKKSTHIYFEHLDVVRFVAAFMIVILHAYEAWLGWYGEVGILSGNTYKELSFWGRYIDQIIKNMGLGVDVFFLLSGFLITYILLEEKKRFGDISIGKFMIRRTLRIWPLYFLLIGITPFLVKWVDMPHPNYLANALFLGNFDVIKTQLWIFPFAHFWSICVEEHFYIVWPFVIAFTPRKHLLKVFTGFIMLSIGFRVYTAVTVAFPWFIFYTHTLSKIDVLVIGAVGAYFYSQKPFEFNLPRYLRYALWATLVLVLMLDPVVAWDTALSAGFKKFLYTGIGFIKRHIFKFLVVMEVMIFQAFNS